MPFEMRVFYGIGRIGVEAFIVTSYKVPNVDPEDTSPWRKKTVYRCTERGAEICGRDFTTSTTESSKEDRGLQTTQGSFIAPSDVKDTRRIIGMKPLELCCLLMAQNGFSKEALRRLRFDDGFIEDLETMSAGPGLGYVKAKKTMSNDRSADICSAMRAVSVEGSEVSSFPCVPIWISPSRSVSVFLSRNARMGLLDFILEAYPMLLSELMRVIDLASKRSPDRSPPESQEQHQKEKRDVAATPSDDDLGSELFEAFSEVSCQRGLSLLGAT